MSSSQIGVSCVGLSTFGQAMLMFTSPRERAGSYPRKVVLTLRGGEEAEQELRRAGLVSQKGGL